MPPWLHFSKDEFACPCGCGQNLIQDRFVDWLDLVRDTAGRPFFINSGYRCPEHNEMVGGVEDSAHTKGLAADIRATDSTDRHHILRAAYALGAKRVGVGSRFIHLDLDPSKPQRVTWVYS